MWMVGDVPCGAGANRHGGDGDGGDGVGRLGVLCHPNLHPNRGRYSIQMDGHRESDPNRVRVRNYHPIRQ